MNRSRRIATFACLGLVLMGLGGGTAAPDGRYRPMPKELIALNSPEGRKLLIESKFQESFWELAQYYAPQPDLGSCSVASCAMVLNALPIERPVSKPHGSFRLFTAENFFNEKVEGITSRRKVSYGGMSLSELTKVLKTFPVKVDCVYSGDSTVDVFRKGLKQALANKDEYVIVNYLRKSLGQESGGHISPIGAYNEVSDAVLILDTANYKYPWTWVPVDRMWNATTGPAEPGTKLTRGYVVVAAESPPSK
jgi:hypothetical protein